MSNTLDELIDSEPGPSSSSDPSANVHLSYPSSEPTANESPEPTPQQPRQLLKDRLYVGNLHPTVDEYSLLQVFSKFGKVTKLDFLFHKTGLLKGKPRGYAFVEYGNNDDALKALSTAHDKLLRGRKLVVTFAHQAPLDQGGASAYGVMGGTKRKGMMETGRPTTLSMLKTGMAGRHSGTQDKIAMMEAKLRQMESTNPNPSGSSSKSSTPSDMSYHASLPLKPLPAMNSSTFPNQPPRSKAKSRPALPSLPILPARPATETRPSAGVSKQGQTSKPSKLIGVKLRAKEKPAAGDATQEHLMS